MVASGKALVATSKSPGARPMSKSRTLPPTTKAACPASRSRRQMPRTSVGMALASMLDVDMKVGYWPSMMTRARSAAFCCASFLDRPKALPYSFSPIQMATSKVLAWSGPCSESTVYEGAI